ncbi:MAG: hypothetical protein FJY85_00765 [Deltaproteobacteria bacterium]|nr:hypothetical protein [Deltaproteobacteria bacterium]
MYAPPVGQLYNHTGELALWPSPNIYGAPPIGATVPGEPILILERLISLTQHWVYALSGGNVGWIKVEYVNLERIDLSEVEYETR